MATKPHTPVPYGSLAALFSALAIGLAPIAVLLAFSAQLGGAK